MGRFRIELKSQYGWVREGKIAIVKGSVPMPSLLIPQHPSLITSWISACDKDSSDNKLSGIFQMDREVFIAKLNRYHDLGSHLETLRCFTATQISLFPSRLIHDPLKLTETGESGVDNSDLLHTNLHLNSSSDGDLLKNIHDIPLFYENLGLRYQSLIDETFSLEKPADPHGSLEYSFNLNSILKSIPNEVLTGDIPLYISIPFPNRPTSDYPEYTQAALISCYDRFSRFIHKLPPSLKYFVEIDGIEYDLVQKKAIHLITSHGDQIVGVALKNPLNGYFEAKDALIITSFWQQIPRDLVKIATGNLSVFHMALYYYMGFDLVDLSYSVLEGTRDRYFTDTDTVYEKDLVTADCSCGACSIFRRIHPQHNQAFSEPLYGKVYEDQIFYQSLLRVLLQLHNLSVSIAEFLKISRAISLKRFRTHLESTAVKASGVYGIIRALDKSENAERFGFNSRMPAVLNSPVNCYTPLSYNRPEIDLFRKRILERLKPNREYGLIVLLPCSAKKPYSTSKSHQRFIKAIKRASRKYYLWVHEVIITSPLGVVPREAESIFPAAHYDIPVTGDWDADEIRIASDQLVGWLVKYDQPQSPRPPLKIIAHLTGGYRQVIQPALDKLHLLGKSFEIIYTIPEDVSYGAASHDAIRCLSETISEQVNQWQENIPVPKSSASTLNQN